MISKEILDILVCPHCRGPVNYDIKNRKVLCKKCKLKYGIIDGRIPDMVVEDAEKF